MTKCLLKTWLLIYQNMCNVHDDVSDMSKGYADRCLCILS